MVANYKRKMISKNIFLEKESQNFKVDKMPPPKKNSTHFQKVSKRLIIWDDKRMVAILAKRYNTHNVGGSIQKSALKMLKSVET